MPKGKAKKKKRTIRDRLLGKKGSASGTMNKNQRKQLEKLGYVDKKKKPLRVPKPYEVGAAKAAKKK
jgi:hypothetical protein